MFYELRRAILLEVGFAVCNDLSITSSRSRFASWYQGSGPKALSNMIRARLR